MLWHIQMKGREKASVICILGLGVFTTAAAIVKMSFLPNYGKTGDWLWDSRNLTIWTVLESAVGIVAGNLPCLTPLFRSALGLNYGHGSRGKSGASQELSRASGAGTNMNAAKGRGFESLASSKAGNTPKDPYQAYMMTTAGEESHAGSTVSIEEIGRNRNGSHNSAEVLDSHSMSANLKLDGTLKTTEVIQSCEGSRVMLPLPMDRVSRTQEDLRLDSNNKDMV